MTQRHPSYYGVIGLLLMTITPFSFSAQSPIAIESREVQQGGSTLPYQPLIEDEFDTQSGGETQYQVQLLQQEVQDLTGLVEELRHQLEQMRRTQNDRYLELDARFQRLTNRPPEATLPIDGVPDAVAVIAGEDEKTLYDNAVELIRARQYELAISQLQAVIARYPEGAFTANAYYWLEAERLPVHIVWL